MSNNTVGPNPNSPYPVQPPPNSGGQSPQYNPFMGTYSGYPQDYQRRPLTKEMISSLRDREASRLIPQKYGKSWSSLVFKPSIVFANQNPDERIYIIAKRHWISNLGWIIRDTFFIALPMIVALIILNLRIDVSFVGFRFLLLFLVIYYSIILTNIIVKFTDWYFDPFIVSNQRILDYDFKPFGTYYVGEMNLEKIEDVKQRSAGLLGDIFNYGNIDILSENINFKISFVCVPNPTKLRDIIT